MPIFPIARKIAQKNSVQDTNLTIKSFPHIRKIRIAKNSLFKTHYSYYCYH